MRAVEKRTSQLKDGDPARAYNRMAHPGGRFCLDTPIFSFNETLHLRTHFSRGVRFRLTFGGILHV
jgi:hypothetical protein